MTKRYGANVAVHDLNFTVQPGHHHRISRPERRWQVDDMRMIGGLDAPTAGTVR